MKKYLIVLCLSLLTIPLYAGMPFHFPNSNIYDCIFSIGENFEKANFFDYELRYKKNFPQIFNSQFYLQFMFGQNYYFNNNFEKNDIKLLKLNKSDNYGLGFCYLIDPFTTRIFSECGFLFGKTNKYFEKLYDIQINDNDYWTSIYLVFSIKKINYYVSYTYDQCDIDLNTSVIKYNNMSLKFGIVIKFTNDWLDGDSNDVY